MCELNDKIKDKQLNEFVNEIHEFIDSNCEKFGFDVDEMESSLSHGYSIQLGLYNICMGLYLMKINGEGRSCGNCNRLIDQDDFILCELETKQDEMTKRECLTNDYKHWKCKKVVLKGVINND